MIIHYKGGQTIVRHNEADRLPMAGTRRALRATWHGYSNGIRSAGWFLAHLHGERRVRGVFCTVTAACRMGAKSLSSTIAIADHLTRLAILSICRRRSSASRASASIVEDEYACSLTTSITRSGAGPVDYIDRPYTLDEIRYSLPLRERMPRVDLDTVTFDTGSWEVAPDQVERLAVIADGINRAIAANPSAGVLDRRPHRCGRVRH